MSQTLHVDDDLLTTEEARLLSDQGYVPVPGSRGFVAKLEPVMPRSKTARNDYCPCGSGKKFKWCCIDKVTAA